MRINRCAVVAVAGLMGLAMSSQGATATAAGEPSGITRVVITTSGGPVIYTDRAQEDPPAIHIEFRSRNVLSELGPVVSVASSMIKEIRSESYRRLIGRRPVKSITLILTQPASYTINQAAGQIVIDIETPPSLMAGTLDVGGGMTILGIEGRDAILQRLEAMSAALQRVSPPVIPVAPGRAPVVVTEPVIFEPTPSEPTPAEPISQRGWGRFWFGLLLGAGGGGALGTFWRRRRRIALAGTPVTPSAPPLPSVSEAGTVLDQLVLSTIQREGQKLVGSKAVADVETLWIIEQDQERRGVLCISDGLFFERKILERFHEALQQEGLRSGAVWALGSFTAPAQTFAKEHGISLIPREEVFKLIERDLSGPSLGRPNAQTSQQQPEEPLPELTEAQSKIQALEQELSTQAEGRQTVKEQLNALEREAQTLKQQLQESEGALTEERTKPQQLEQRLSELQATMTAQETQCAQKEQSAEQLLSTSQHLTQEAVKLKEQLEEFQQRLQEEQAKRQELELHVAQLEHQLAAKGRIDLEAAAEAEQPETAKMASPMGEGASREEKEVLPEAAPQESPAFVERRKVPRIDLALLGGKGLIVRMETPGTNARPFIGRIINMSSKGLLVEGDTELTPSDALAVELFPFDSLDAIEGRGRFIWQQRQAESSKVHIGIALTSISKRNRSRLSRYTKQVEEIVPAPVGGKE